MIYSRATVQTTAPFFASVNTLNITFEEAGPTRQGSYMYTCPSTGQWRMRELWQAVVIGRAECDRFAAYSTGGIAVLVNRMLDASRNFPPGGWVRGEGDFRGRLFKNASFLRMGGRLPPKLFRRCSLVSRRIRKYIYLGFFLIFKRFFCSNYLGICFRNTHLLFI